MSIFITASHAPALIRTPTPPADFGLPVRTLGVAEIWRTPATATLLAGEIGRHPGNLHTHMQRISIWHALRNHAQTAAAVVDLWIALGAFGLDLRTRMLHQHHAALERHNLDIYLHARLHRGVDRHDPQLALRGVVLARPVEGNRVFLRSATTSSASADIPRTP